MNTAQLKKPRFSGATLAKLVGITVKQFFNLRATGLMIDKSRYSLQDVFFVALCNDFRVRANKSWLSIIKLFETVFKDLETAENIDFINNDVLTIGFDGDKNLAFEFILNHPSIEGLRLSANDREEKSLKTLAIEKVFNDVENVDSKVFFSDSDNDNDDTLPHAKNKNDKKQKKSKDDFNILKEQIKEFKLSKDNKIKKGVPVISDEKPIISVPKTKPDVKYILIADSR